MTAAKAKTPAVKTASVFIDGEAGTTGLQIRERLESLDGITIKSIDPKLRKDARARAQMMREADAVVLCLPDDAAKEAVALADSLGDAAPKIIDASTVHRVSNGWVYGFAELDGKQAGKIRDATRVANPGCYPTGAIALIRPLIDACIMPADYSVSVNAVSGYSGGGKAMIESYEVSKTAPAFELYALALEHKHVPELMAYSGLTRRPVFVPSVGNFKQGMLVSVPLHLDTLPGKPSLSELETALEKHYRGCETVRLVRSRGLNRLEPEALNNTDQLELFVFGNEQQRQALLVARLDNLGKGAAGAAVQNLQLMLGLA